MARDHKKKGSGNSNYARKERFLHHNGGFGFDWPSKPWKS